MWFLAKDRAIPISNLVFTDNLATYHNTMSFTTVSKLFVTEGVISTNFAKFDVRITSQTRTSDDEMKVDCETKAVHSAFDSITAGYVGRTTVNKLFAKLGFGYKSEYQTNNTYFSIPQCSVVTLFDNLTKYASFANGGGAHFYMAYDGTVHGFDYKLIKEKANPTVLHANILSEQIKTDWLDYTPSEYDIFVYDNNNNFKRETLSLEKGFGRGAVYLNDTTGVWKDVAKQELTNIFYNKWYSADTITVTTLYGVIPPLGCLVDLNNTGDTYIVKAVSTVYNELEEIPSTTVNLITNPTI